jgi:hypothetical protein
MQNTRPDPGISKFKKEAMQNTRPDPAALQ